MSRTRPRLLLAALVGAAAAVAPAQTVVVELVPSDAAPDAGTPITIDIAFTNSDAPNSGIAVMNAAITVNGPGAASVVSPPVFVDIWPVVFGQSSTVVTPDLNGGFTELRGARFGPILNPPVLVSYDVVFTQPGTYTVEIASVSGNGIGLAVDGGLPFDPASVQFLGTTIEVGGTGQCSPADLVMPFGIVDLDDVDGFISAFLDGDPSADLVFPFGVVDLDDVDAFITAFLAGCP